MRQDLVDFNGDAWAGANKADNDLAACLILQTGHPGKDNIAVLQQDLLDFCR